MPSETQCNCRTCQDNGAPLLSHWWRTESAQAADDRAAQARRERLEKVKREFQERKAASEKAVLDWTVIQA